VVFVRKPSHALIVSQIENLYDAACYAFCLNRPLNEFVSIHCERGGISNPDVQRFISQFVKLCSDWSRRRSGQPHFFVWVLESKGGSNLHLLVHVSPNFRLEYVRRQKVWLRLAGAKVRKGVLVTKHLECSDTTDDPILYLVDGLIGTLRYICKGAVGSVPTRFAVEPEPQGIVFGKRAGWSEALGRGRRRYPKGSLVERRKWTVQRIGCLLGD
jgi:hypothetical protein